MPGKTGFIISLICTTLLFCGCVRESADKPVHTSSSKAPKSGKINKSIPQTISIYRYGDFPFDKAEKLRKRLQDYFPNVVLKERALPLPANHYNKERNRYRGTGLYEDLGQHRNEDVVIGLTNYVIFLANDKSPTFGIMGVSPLGAYKCVVSSKLPKTGAEHTEDNFRKLALHELGHAFGLNHCPNQHCYMVDAEHKMKFPQTTGFCESCSKTLNSKGWKISVTPNTNMGQ